MEPVSLSLLPTCNCFLKPALWWVWIGPELLLSPPLTPLLLLSPPPGGEEGRRVEEDGRGGDGETGGGKRGRRGVEEEGSGGGGESGRRKVGGGRGGVKFSHSPLPISFSSPISPSPPLFSPFFQFFPGLPIATSAVKSCRSIAGSLFKYGQCGGVYSEDMALSQLSVWRRREEAGDT